MKVVVRADGGSGIGMGHIMRCIGLAHEFVARGADVRFLISQVESAVTDRLAHEGFTFEQILCTIGSADDAAQTSKYCQSLNASFLVIDGYGFGSSWLEAVSSIALKTLLWTDYLQDVRLPVDFLLDQTPAASAATYSAAAPCATLFCGLRYAVLRPEFLNAEGIRRQRGELRNVLITLGGTDPAGVTRDILLALRDLPSKLRIKVVIGPSNAFRDEIEKIAHANDKCEVFSAVTNMAEYVGWADLALSAAGTSLWEFAYSGLPAIATSIADNQLPLAASLDELGGGINLGPANALEGARIRGCLTTLLDRPDKLTSMSARMMSMVDGRGASRVVDAMYRAH